MTDIDHYTDSDHQIEDCRGQLISSLNAALTALTQAHAAITALISDKVYDVAFAKCGAGHDVGAFVTDSLRFTRAAYAITHSATERG